MTEQTATAPDLFVHFFTVAQTMYRTHDPDRVASFQARMDDLRTKYPNQWVAYIDDADEPDALSWRVNGPFPDESAAVAWGMNLPPAERSLWTVIFVDAPEIGVERVNRFVREPNS
jgi:hypothetical protein